MDKQTKKKAVVGLIGLMILFLIIIVVVIYNWSSTPVDDTIPTIGINTDSSPNTGSGVDTTNTDPVKLQPKEYLISTGVGAPSTLSQGQSLTSTDSRWKLTLQSDGDLVGTADGQTWWNSKSGGKGTPPYQAVMQPDANFVIYDSASKPIWYTGSQGGTPPYQLVMQTDRNIVVYDSTGKALWNASSNA